jgi:hypothetical protein
MMSDGLGKYDDLCTYVREQAKAMTAIIIVLDGEHGSGFSLQSHVENSRAFLPDLLETMAADIRRNMGKREKPKEGPKNDNAQTD